MGRKKLLEGRPPTGGRGKKGQWGPKKREEGKGGKKKEMRDLTPNHCVWKREKRKMGDKKNLKDLKGDAVVYQVPMGGEPMQKR